MNQVNFNNLETINFQQLFNLAPKLEKLTNKNTGELVFDKLKKELTTLNIINRLNAISKDKINIGLVFSYDGIYNQGKCLFINNCDNWYCLRANLAEETESVAGTKYIQDYSYITAKSSNATICTEEIHLHTVHVDKVLTELVTRINLLAAGNIIGKWNQTVDVDLTERVLRVLAIVIDGHIVTPALVGLNEGSVNQLIQTEKGVIVSLLSLGYVFNNKFVGQGELVYIN